MIGRRSLPGSPHDMRQAPPLYTATLGRYLPLPLGSLRVNTPVPVDIWSARGTLLLARFQTLESQAQIDQLAELQPMVRDIHYFELLLGSGDPQDVIAGADLNPLIGWPALHERLGALLRGEVEPGELSNRLAVLAAAAGKMLAAHRDKSLFMLTQMIYDRELGYCASHALMSAAVCQLLARDAGLCDWERDSLGKAALTMNIAMSALQDQLAQQAGPPDEAQRSHIAGHAQQSAVRLRELGVTDPFWLDLVEHHHDPVADHEDPAANSQLIAASLLWMVDQWVARISPRRSRSGLMPSLAARTIYVAMQTRDAALGNLLVKTLGIYPPGSYVKLRTGEIAVVVGSGDRAHQPLTLAVVSANGIQFQHPIARDTQREDCAVTASLVIAPDVSIRLNPTKLFRQP